MSALELEDLLHTLDDEDKQLTTDDMESVSNAITDLRKEILFNGDIVEDAFDLMAKEHFLEALAHLDLAAIAFRPGHIRQPVDHTGVGDHATLQSLRDAVHALAKGHQHHYYLSIRRPHGSELHAHHDGCRPLWLDDCDQG